MNLGIWVGHFGKHSFNLTKQKSTIIFLCFIFPPKKIQGKRSPTKMTQKLGSIFIGSTGYFTYLFFPEYLGVVTTHWNPFTFSWLLNIQVDFWYFYLHLPWKSAIHVGKYTSPMDDMGCEPPSFSVLWNFQGTETSNPRTARLPTVESP